METVKIEGLDELLKQFAQLPDEMVLKLGGSTVDCAEIVASKARSKVHSIEQDLINGIVVKKPGKSKKKAYRVFSMVQLDKSARHGIPVELGHRFSGYLWRQADTKRVPEHPFLRPAADESKDQVVSIMTNAMNDLLREYGGK